MCYFTVINLLVTLFFTAHYIPKKTKEFSRYWLFCTFIHVALFSELFLHLRTNLSYFFIFFKSFVRDITIFKIFSNASCSKITSKSSRVLEVSLRRLFSEYFATANGKKQQRKR